MGLELPKRARRMAFGAVTASSLFLLSGCAGEDSSTFKRLAMPVPATEEAPHTLHLWQGAWIAALITGAIVWGLIFYSAFHYRRRSVDDIPVQTRYNLPIEIFYTIAPIMMVIVFFFFTIKTQGEVLHNDDHPDHTISVVGQQWSWAFNYNYDTGAKKAVGGQVVHEIGTPAETPTLWMVKGESVEIHLYSPDVIHSFWVPAFLFKMDVVPGRDNHFALTPNRTGTFAGHCAELCGTYHSRMLFNVKVVDRQAYDDHLAELAKEGQTGPAIGGSQVGQQTGLESGSQNGEAQ